MMLNIAQVLKGDLSNLNDSSVFDEVSAHYSLNEDEWLCILMEEMTLSAEEERKIGQDATELIQTIRSKPNVEDSLDALLRQYNLSTKEGLVLMCLAEALLRIPDKESVDAFIKDKIVTGNWSSYEKNSDHFLINFATWGLALTGSIVSVEEGNHTLKQLTKNLTAPVIRSAIYQAMKIMGKQFVLGRTIQEAINNGKKTRSQGSTYTFDMLGEAALTQEDADQYFEAYKNALLTTSHEKDLPNSPKPSLSIKLSALHQRYEVAQKNRVLTELFERVRELAVLGREHNVEISIDAEEADRLELSLTLFQKLISDPAIKGWGGLGLVVQAYSKCALPTLVWTTLLGKKMNTAIPIRLVKGAYWDTEIKASQVRGLQNYPLYTRKESTDLSYVMCAKYLLSEATAGIIRPQFATHNAYTVTSILAIAGERSFEFQRLHGMGEALYDEVIAKTGRPVRIYAPVGEHRDLLPYLVRRLLENGANSSFVHQLVDPNISIESLTQSPIALLRKQKTLHNSAIALPSNILAGGRKNSKGLNVNIASEWLPFEREYAPFLTKKWIAKPIINGQLKEDGERHEVFSPFDLDRKVGEVFYAHVEHVHEAILQLDKAWFSWNETEVNIRAIMLEKLADLLELNRAELIAITCVEAGKSIQDGIDEVREAVDFCRYYAQEARQKCQVRELQGPTGEMNRYYTEGKGIFACISPWNFPLAIYLGQIGAALVSGNVVLIKPAETTSLIAARTVELMFEAGFPKEAIAFLPGDGKTLGDIFAKDPRVVGVCFTGSTQTAQYINQHLANRSGSIATLIAETGGQNVMFADSTSLPEQVVKDALHSAFISAGQRCSALRVLYLQEDVADRIIRLLKGALNDLVVGKPYKLSTDLGSVIDERAQTELLNYIERTKKEAKLIAEVNVDPELKGYFVPPTIFEIRSISALIKENFGPILHIIRYRREDLIQMIKEVNATNFGLTMGVHSRNDETVKLIERYARVGNFYVNRNQVGAVVGVQPFGGRGLSGTGPKAGGPNYLSRFMNERSTSINTAAIGGNAGLLTLSDI